MVVLLVDGGWPTAGVVRYRYSLDIPVAAELRLTKCIATSDSSLVVARAGAAAQ